jgi:HAD superfamily hydrolase (TIGR01549 family)
MTHDAVVFDMDGVLVERSPAWVFEEAANDALAAVGIDDPDDEDYRAVRGIPADHETVTARFEERHGLDFETVWATREAFASANQRVAVREGEKSVYEDATTLSRLPVDVAVVSNNQHGTVGRLLGYFDFDAHVREWYGLRPTLADLDRRKPDPTYLRRALDALDGEDPVYVGDRESDVETAAGAGIASAFVRRPCNQSVTLQVEPTYELDSLRELLELTG